MKVALTVLHGNITDSNCRYVGNKEALKIAELLSHIVETDVLTCKECSYCIHVDSDYDINKYDKLFIVNGSINMFGGIEIDTATTIYKLLHKFNGQIYYILTDTNMPFMDYYKHINGKDWAKKYTKDNFSLQHDIIILSQFKNFDYIKKIHKNINIKDILYVPWALWKIELETNNNYYNVEKTADLIYGGSFRAGKRVNKMLDYFFNKENISVELYGNISLSQFNKYEYNLAPKFTGKILTDAVVEKNSSGLATIIIGDRNYNNNTVTLRFYESLMSDAIVFIDNDFDTEHKLLTDDWLYVNSGDELEEKILKLKNNPNLLNALITNQHKLVQSLLQEKTLHNCLKEILYEN